MTPMKIYFFSIFLYLILPFHAFSAVITVTPDMPDSDAISIIQAAESGDIVELAFGIYQFRLYLDKPGVTVRAQDPANKPVFDYTGKRCDQWPGTQAAGKWFARYGIVIQADNILMENIVVNGAKFDTKSAGIYVGPMGTHREPADPGTQPNNVTLRGVEVSDCDDGIVSTGINFLLEDSVLHGNGDRNSSKGRHNMYVQGGSFTIRNTHFYNAISGQNINSRARIGVIENCILDKPKSYQALLLTPKADMVKGTFFEQKLIFRNCIINGEDQTKVFELANTNNYYGLSQYLELYNNEINGVPGRTQSIVFLNRRPDTVSMGITSVGNIYTNYDNFLRLAPGEDISDPFYEIDLQDVNLDGNGDDQADDNDGQIDDNTEEIQKLLTFWWHILFSLLRAL